MTGRVDPAVDRAGEPVLRATDLTGTLVLKHDRLLPAQRRVR